MHRISPRLLLAMLTMILAGTAHATPHYLTDGGRIGAALRAGQIEPAEALWLAYLQHFEPDALPLPYRGEFREGIQCSTGLVIGLRENWDRFTPGQRARIEARISPFGSQHAPPPPPAPMEDDTCWGQQMQNRVMGDHFSVEWNNGTVNEATAEDFLESLEYSWEVEVEQLGWRAPEGSDDYLFAAFISSNYEGGAFTSIDVCNGHAVPYIVAASDAFNDPIWAQDMAAHEFNHAMQFGYGDAHEFWWWEATATYIEDDVYPSHEGWSPYIYGYAENPWMAMNTTSDSDYWRFMHMYGMAIFAFHIDQHLGGEDLVRQTWDESQGYHQEYYSLTMETLLGDLGYGWRETYREFMAVNTVMDYDDQGYYPSISIERTVGSLPADGESSSGSTPESYGQNFIRFDTGEATGDEPDLLIEFEGADNGDWEVVLVGTTDDRVEETVTMEVDEGIGQARLEDFGDFDRAWLVVSPCKRSGSAFSYAWTAETAESISTGDDDDDDGDDDGGDKGVLIPGEGCQCRAAPAKAGGWAAVAGLIAGILIRRRR